MSYPKEPCNIVACPYNKVDKDYPIPICIYSKDITEAILDDKIAFDCLWLKEVTDIWELDNESKLDETSTSAELKAERVARSQIQEQNFQKVCRDPALHVEDGEDTDNIVFRNGFIELVDSKFSDDDTFYISKNDIIKGLDFILRLKNRSHEARLVVDMWFPRHKLRRNIYLDETNRGFSLKTWVAGKRIMTKKADYSRG